MYRFRRKLRSLELTPLLVRGTSRVRVFLVGNAALTAGQFVPRLPEAERTLAEGTGADYKSGFHRELLTRVRQRCGNNDISARSSLFSFIIPFYCFRVGVDGRSRPLRLSPGQ